MSKRMEGSKMIVTDLNKMEEIVNTSPNLFWDGWTVVHKTKTNKGIMSKHGLRINGKWHIVKRFEPTKSGWSIPEGILNA